MNTDEQKQKAADRALGFIEDGMVIGLGTGSTANYFIEGLGARIEEGLSVTGVATSSQTAELASKCGITVVDIDAVSGIDVTVDGADEVDPNLYLIKGGGGALLREKIVAAASDRMIVIIDEGKLVEFLGAFPLPIEIVQFGMSATTARIRRVLIDEGCSSQDLSLRRHANGDPFVSDGGNFILDCTCSSLIDPKKLAQRLGNIPGVVEHGLFIDMASSVIVGREDRVDIIEQHA